MKNIAINITKGKGKGQRKKAVKALRLNGYPVENIHGVGEMNKKRIAWSNLSNRLTYYHDTDKETLTLKKQGGGDWSKLYELIEKDKGSVIRLPEHEDSPVIISWHSINASFNTYPQYGKDVDPDKIDAYFDGEDTLKVVTNFLDKVEITGLPELGKIDGDLVTGRPQQSWDYPCYGRGNYGLVVLFVKPAEGTVVVPNKHHLLGLYKYGWAMAGFTPTNIVEDNPIVVRVVDINDPVAHHTI